MSAKIGSEYTSSTITARKVILATGIRDIIPNTPGLAENFGKGIYWCPWCDGHEHEDQPIGVLGSLDVSANTPLEILSLNKNIILFVNGTDTPENRAIADKKLPDWDEWLQINAIKIENRTITALERLRDGTNNSDPSRATNPEHDLFRVHFSSGDPIERAAFMTNFKSEQKSNLGANTGVALYGGRLAANVSKGMESNIPGIYSVGDANSDNSTNVPHAMWSAKRAVVSLHGVFQHYLLTVVFETDRSIVALETENAKAQVAGLTKRDLGLEDLQTLWRRINGPDDFLDAGEFDQ
jgi:thioredoxin reductase